MATAIWKDTIITLASGTAAFNIRLNNVTGTIIYSGKADTINGQRKVRINDICADYIANDLPRFGETYGNNHTMTFCVEQGGVSKGVVTFYWNWSYDYDFSDTRATGADAVSLNFPIRRDVGVGTYYPFCYTDMAGATIAITIGGTDFTTSYNTQNTFDWFILDGSRVAMLDAIFVSAPVNVAKYAIGAGRNATAGVEIRGVYKCVDFVVYYLNAYGGWDALEIEGTIKPIADFSRTTSKRAYNNNYRQSEGTIVSVNEVTRKISFNTGWLDDVGASRMHHLLGTTKAILFDTQTLEATPLVITDNTWERKSHRADGMVNYTINAEVAQSFIRR